jgi:hypothetical protein
MYENPLVSFPKLGNSFRRYFVLSGCVKRFDEMSAWSISVHCKPYPIKHSKLIYFLSIRLIAITVGACHNI